ncbi:MAG: oxidoreductase [Verrucomicrobiota bacterium]|jgi:F420-non-reducing hydrogenase small subunit
MPKPKIAFYWCASCGGCEEAVVDLAEDILGVVEAVDIVLWPVAMDFKKKDVEAMPDKSIVATLFNGAIRTSEQEEMAHLLRRKSQVLIAYGACAQMGGIPSLANQFSRDQLLRFVYEQAPTMADEPKSRPQTSFQNNGHALTLPQFRNVVRSLDQVVEVDYCIPGCPPTPKITKAAVGAVLEGKLPPKGSVLAPDIALCDQCPRKGSKPADLSFTQFKRPHMVKLDPELCFLAQDVVCMGPATRGGCESVCTRGNMPCSGCFGPTSRVRDQGAKMLSSLCANVAAKEEKDITQTLSGIPDPVGTFYRYSLASSLLRRKVDLPIDAKKSS